MNYNTLSTIKSTNKTACGNTRSNRQTSSEVQVPSVPTITSHIDYYRGRITNISNEELYEFIFLFLDFCNQDTPSVLQTGEFSIGKHCKKYPFCYSDLYGGRIMFQEASSGDDDTPSCGTDLLLELPGSFWQSLPIDEHMHYLSIFTSRGLLCTRIDLAIDDTAYHFSDEFLRSVQFLRNYGYARTHRRVTEYSQSLKTEVTTYYFGSRQSDAYVRIYDCLPVHGIYAQRYEVEYKGKKAIAVVDILLQVPDSHDIAEWYRDNLSHIQTISSVQDSLDDSQLYAYYQHQIASIALGSLVFIDRKNMESGGHLSRSDVLPEWSSFVKRCLTSTPTRIKVSRESKTIERNETWIERQVLKSLYTRFVGLDSSCFLKWLTSLFNKHSISSKIDDFDSLIINYFRTHKKPLYTFSLSNV